MISDGYVHAQFTDNETDNESENSIADKNNDISTHLYDSNIKKSKSVDNIYKSVSIHKNLSKENFKNNLNQTTQTNNTLFFGSTDNYIFVICKDSTPIGWVNNKDDASKYILNSVWKEKGKQLLEHSDFNYNIVIEEPSLVYLCSSYKNWFISYDNILCEFSYHKIKYLNK